MMFRLNIERDLEQIGNVGQCVKYLCRRADYSCSSQIDLMLAELLSNVIRHSTPNVGEQCELPVGITIDLQDELITLSVSEVGEPMSRDVIKQYTETDISMPSIDGDMMDLPESGWGVQLLKSLCDDISYERVDGSNVFYLCFDRNPVAA